jgi:hypothetical protein
MLGSAVRVERMLEHADHQHLRVVLGAIFGAVAVVHVEIDHRHARQPWRLQARAAAATAMLLKKQKPIAVSRSAWWPGGRMAQKAF